MQSLYTFTLHVQSFPPLAFKLPPGIMRGFDILSLCHLAEPDELLENHVIIVIRYHDFDPGHGSVWKRPRLCFAGAEV